MTNDGAPGPLSRAEIIARARTWVDGNVHYLDLTGTWPMSAPDPQGRHYRTDCSGFVAMAWAADHQPATCDFDSLGYEIEAADLRSGDAVLWKGEGGYGDGGGHVVLFDQWADPGRTEYVCFELSGGSYAHRVIHRYPYPRRGELYVAWRPHSVKED